MSECPDEWQWGADGSAYNYDHYNGSYLRAHPAVNAQWDQGTQTKGPRWPKRKKGAQTDQRTVLDSLSSSDGDQARYSNLWYPMMKMMQSPAAAFWSSNNMEDAVMGSPMLPASSSNNMQYLMNFGCVPYCSPTSASVFQTASGGCVSYQQQPQDGTSSVLTGSPVCASSGYNAVTVTASPPLALQHQSVPASQSASGGVAPVGDGGSPQVVVQEQKAQQAQQSLLRKAQSPPQSADPVKDSSAQQRQDWSRAPGGKTVTTASNVPGGLQYQAPVPAAPERRAQPKNGGPVVSSGSPSARPFALPVEQLNGPFPLPPAAASAESTTCDPTTCSREKKPQRLFSSQPVTSSPTTRSSNSQDRSTTPQDHSSILNVTNEQEQQHRQAQVKGSGNYVFCLPDQAGLSEMEGWLLTRTFGFKSTRDDRKGVWLGFPWTAHGRQRFAKHGFHKLAAKSLAATFNEAVTALRDGSFVGMQMPERRTEEINTGNIVPLSALRLVAKEIDVSSLHEEDLVALEDLLERLPPHLNAPDGSWQQVALSYYYGIPVAINAPTKSRVVPSAEDDQQGPFDDTKLRPNPIKDDASQPRLKDNGNHGDPNETKAETTKAAANYKLPAELTGTSTYGGTFFAPYNGDDGYGGGAPAMTLNYQHGGGVSSSPTLPSTSAMPMTLPSLSCAVSATPGGAAQVPPSTHISAFLTPVPIFSPVLQHVSAGLQPSWSSQSVHPQASPEGDGSRAVQEVSRSGLMHTAAAYPTAVQELCQVMRELGNLGPSNSHLLGNLGPSTTHDTGVYAAYCNLFGTHDPGEASSSAQGGEDYHNWPAWSWSA
ncbi:unnamed protein product [Amoebophrya sp. A25]|nr:unnamed protein product [Amoebophrya sp. A25]|eukprot:GSA25T00014089001.1